jgi:predicted cupin superfamily sugar epimerase
MLPAEIIKILGLIPATCGYVSEPFRSAVELPASVLPTGYSGDHSLGNVLYFLVTHDAGVQLHRIRSDQMYHHYLGEPLEVLLLYADGRHEIKTVGNDLMSGMRPQLLVPGGTFHAARVKSPDGYALLGTSVWLRAEPSDVEMGNAAKLADDFPKAQTLIESFTTFVVRGATP